jgi:hypothetical protein
MPTSSGCPLSDRDECDIFPVGYETNHGALLFPMHQTFQKDDEYMQTLLCMMSAPLRTLRAIESARRLAFNWSGLTPARFTSAFIACRVPNIMSRDRFHATVYPETHYPIRDHCETRGIAC